MLHSPSWLTTAVRVFGWRGLERVCLRVKDPYEHIEVSYSVEDTDERHTLIDAVVVGVIEGQVSVDE